MRTISSRLPEVKSQIKKIIKIGSPMREKHSLLVGLAVFFTLGSGLINLYSVVGRHFPGRIEIIRSIFPIEFIHISKFLTLLIGFALVISSINLLKRKKRAFQSVLMLSCASAVFHLTRGLNYEEAILSILLIIILLATRKYFTVRSSILTLPVAILRAGLAFLIAIFYGSLGFWVIESRHFQFNFHWHDAILETLKYLSFIGDPDLVPYTNHATWFINSLYLISATALIYAIFALYRPMIYRYRTYPREIIAAGELIEKYGFSALDYFKAWPDKSFFFSQTRESFIAYSVGNNFAIGLGDPVGPVSEIETIVQDFAAFCTQNDWGMAFHQTMPDLLQIYEKLGMKKLKVGDDAIVNLTEFSLEGNSRKSLRQAVNRVEELGVSSCYYKAPLPDDIIAQAKEISDQWLKIQGHRERGFTLGLFDENYIRATPLILARDKNGRPQAFMNQIPSFRKGEATIDLMRRTKNSANGIIDYLFIKLFLQLKEQGFIKFNMGLAPMAGFQEHEESSTEEKAIHFFFGHMNFLFRYRGLRHFKAKYATSWEPRYAIYRSYLDLPKMALALREISEIKRGRLSQLAKPYY
jgi:phosphatidylglycerol lysyltransferase